MKLIKYACLYMKINKYKIYYKHINIYCIKENGCTTEKLLIQK